MHLCDVAEALEPRLAEWVADLTTDGEVAAVAGDESNVTELASFFDHANRVMVE